MSGLATNTSRVSAVDRCRAHFTAARVIERHQRLHHYTGRNATSTDACLRHHYDAATALVESLPRALQGMLWHEHRLASRIAENGEHATPRPELTRRLRILRREIHQAAQTKLHGAA